MKNTIIELWKNKGKILEGIKNSIFKQEHIEERAKAVLEICKTNKCGYYNEAGDSPSCFVPGKPCCTACGCKLEWKARSLSSDCGLATIGQKPLWTAVMTEAEEDEFRKTTGITND